MRSGRQLPKRRRRPPATSVGAGPGRFTIELARLDTRVAATDISRRQLDLNRENVSAAGADHHVESRAARAHQPGVIELAHAPGVEQVLDQVLTTGALTADMNDGHQLKVYRWAELVALLDWEVRLSREPGIRDAGTHLLAAVRTPA